MITKRFPVVPVLALILKIAAILFLLISTFVLAREIIEATKSPMSGFKWTLDIVLNIVTKWFEQTLFPSTTAWVAAELMLGVRDIEYNSRRALLGNAQSAEAMLVSVTAEPSIPNTPSEADYPGKQPAE